MISNYIVEPLKPTRAILFKVWIIYEAIVLFIFCSALINLFYPDIFQIVLSEDVGEVSFVCLFIIQSIFDSFTLKTFKKYPYQFYAMITVYLLDAYFVILTIVKPTIIIFVSLVSILTLANIYCELQYRFFNVKTFSYSYQNYFGGGIFKQSGMEIVTGNILAFAILLGGGNLLKTYYKDLIKSILGSGLIISYLKKILKTKVEQFLNNTATLNNRFLIYYAYEMIKPVRTALLPKLKKLQKIKGKK